jgi:uncharacterized surface protein with fasciclin (FAS1) repeats
MKLTINKWLKTATLVVGAASFIASCNKELPDAIPNETTVPSGQSIADVINNGSNFTILKAALAKAAPATGTDYILLSTLLANKSNVYTFFAPTDDAFKASGIASAAVVNSSAFTAGRLDSLLRYHLVGGLKVTSADIPSTFPFNRLVQSTLVIAQTTATFPGLKMPLFPGKNNGVFFANTTPVVEADMQVANGVIHKTAALVPPPSQLLAQILAGSDYSYFRAAIARGDEGQTGLNRFDSVMKTAPANITVFAPNNAAFQQFLTAKGLPASETSIALLPVATVRGIVAYHLVNGRAFSVNMPTTPGFIPTLVNVSAPTHPGVRVATTFTTPFTADFTLSGVGNGGVVANVLTKDANAINGVVHKIDQVLLPQ